MWDWLSIIVIIAIVLVVLDGLRRKFRERNALRVKLDSSVPGGPDDHNSELPSGGARTVPRGEKAASASRRRREADAGERIEPAFGDVLDDAGPAGDSRVDDPLAADLDEYEGEDGNEGHDRHEDHDASEDGSETGYEDGQDQDDTREAALSGAIPEEDTPVPEAYELPPETPLSLDSPDEGFDEEPMDDPDDESEAPVNHDDGPAPSRAPEDDALVADRDDAPESRKPHKKASRSLSDRFFRHSSVQNELPLEEDEDEESVDDEDGEEEDNEVEEVIIINVMAPRGQAFDGSQLLQILLRQGMRLGNMSIFHRHADNSGSGPVMFSMANMVKPGTFDMASMESFTTPGVSLFTQLPSRLPHMRNFDLMLETAQCLRDELGGELKDENRSVLTRQTIEHYRQRIRDFELHRLARR